MRATASSGGEDRTARVSGLFLLVGAAAITGGWHALYAAAMLVDGRVRPGAFVGVVVPLSVSLALVAGIGWLRRTGVSAGSVYRAGMWTVGCGLLASLLGTAVLVHQAANGVLMVERPYVVVSLATGGAGAGFLVGVYDARLLASVRRLSAERERTGQLEQRLRVLNRVLRHDIRNDANVIRGYAELLDGSDPAEAIDRRAADLVHTGENARYVEELIDADRLAAERVDATGIAADAVAAVGAGFPDVHVELATSGRAVASANRLLHAAVENVVENAAEHNDAEEPWVEVRVSVDAEWVTIEVADNGPGIPETEVAVLSRGAETPLRHSSGLGLWLVNWVVGDCGGRVDFHEREPRGSVVALELPAAGDAT